MAGFALQHLGDEDVQGYLEVIVPQMRINGHEPFGAYADVLPVLEVELPIFWLYGAWLAEMVLLNQYRFPMVMR